MWQLDKSNCISSSSAKTEEIIPPICTRWWHKPAIAWMTWSAPKWVNRIMTLAFGRTWRRIFPYFFMHHFIYTGEWEVGFSWWGEPYGIVYKQRFAKARSQGIPSEYLPSEDSYLPNDDNGQA